MDRGYGRKKWRKGGKELKADGKKRRNGGGNRRRMERKRELIGGNGIRN
jgi:hypothetical protein